MVKILKLVKLFLPLNLSFPLLFLHHVPHPVLLDHSTVIYNNPLVMDWMCVSSQNSCAEILVGKDRGSGTVMHANCLAQCLAHTRLVRSLWSLLLSFLPCWNPIFSTMLLPSLRPAPISPAVWSRPLLQTGGVRTPPPQTTSYRPAFSPKQLEC